MSPAATPHDRWRRIEELFHAAVDLPDRQRDIFLTDSCGADLQLRSEVESLLASDYGDSPLIAGIVDAAANGLLDEDL
ncbi:MAG TPA: hypothetical protein VGL72_18550 [Bryobacteraceae bacterium]|jgi:hypothetical protein